MGDLVECRSDDEYAGRPLAFYWQDIRHEVNEVLSRDRTPDGYTFRVRNKDQAVFVLIYDIQSDQWSVNPI
jgi:hypothetical protein